MIAQTLRSPGEVQADDADEAEDEADQRRARTEVAPEICAEREEADRDRDEAHHLTEHACVADALYRSEDPPFGVIGLRRAHHLTPADTQARNHNSPAVVRVLLARLGPSRFAE